MKSHGNLRLKVFDSFKDHAWYARQLTKLSKADLKVCRDFLAQTDSLNKQDFAHVVNRMFLGVDKTKNWSLIMELLSSANSALEDI